MGIFFKLTDIKLKNIPLIKQTKSVIGFIIVLFVSDPHMALQFNIKDKAKRKAPILYIFRKIPFFI